MKKIFGKFGKPGIVIAILIALVAMFAFGQIVYDLKNALTWTSVISPRISHAADTSSAIDVSPYVGKVVFVQTVTGLKGTTVTFTSKIQQSSDGTTFTSAPADSAFTNCTSAAGVDTGSIQYKTYDPRVTKRYLRYITTISASDSVAYAVQMIAQSRSR